MKAFPRWEMFALASAVAVGCQSSGAGRRDAAAEPPLADTAMRVTPEPRAVSLVVPNDNRLAGGTALGGVVTVRLEARVAGWRPDADVDSAVTIQAFGEEGGATRIPGPLIRATQGAEVHLTIRNAVPDSTLIVYGLRAGTVRNDCLHVSPGETRDVRFRAGDPGTYLYWGTTTRAAMELRMKRDAQLTGAIVIDAPDARVDASERIFVITLLDLRRDTTRSDPQEDVWEAAINGLSWPHTERLSYEVGDTVRWRMVNGTNRVHPMHLHGFHFRVLSEGNGRSDIHYAAAARRDAVTQLLLPGATARVDWVPTRVGNWLVHCHMIEHITPYPERADSLRGHDMHDVARHPMSSMNGLVMGITTVDSRGRDRPVTLPVSTRYRVLAQEGPLQGTQRARSFVLQRGAEPARDSVVVPGSTLVFTRGERAEVTVVNRLAEATSVHWHGMELESVYDGVAGWSGNTTRVAPLIAPGDSFTVTFTPPRAGTFIYHTHMDEGGQLPTGMYAALLVLEPGQSYDPTTDLTIMLGGAVNDGRLGQAINGRHTPEPLRLRVGSPYRLRFINILPMAAARLDLVDADSMPVVWRRAAKDGAELPPSARVDGPATWIMGVGETYDFEWTPAKEMDAVLHVRFRREGLAPKRWLLQVRR